MPRSRGRSPTLSEKNCLDVDIPVISLEPAPKIQASQVHHLYNITPLHLKSSRTQYGNIQMGGEDRKGQRDRGGYWGIKVDLVVEKSSGPEASNYYHIIYQC